MRTFTLCSTGTCTGFDFTTSRCAIGHRPICKPQPCVKYGMQLLRGGSHNRPPFTTPHPSLLQLPCASPITPRYAAPLAAHKHLLSQAHFRLGGCFEPGTRYQIPRAWYIRRLTPGTKYQVAGASCLVPGIKCQVSCARLLQKPQTKCLVSSARCRVPASFKFRSCLLIETSEASVWFSILRYLNRNTDFLK